MSAEIFIDSSRIDLIEGRISTGKKTITIKNKELLDSLVYRFFPTHTILNERGPQRLNQFSIVNVVDAIWKNEQRNQEWRKGRWRIMANSVKMSPKIKCAACVALKDK